MNKFLTVKEASEQSGLPKSVIRDLCNRESCKHTIHRFGKGKTSPIYIDWDEMLKVIRSGKVD